MKVKLPFEPSSLGQHAACAAMDDLNHLDNSIKLNHEQKIRLENFFKTNNFSYIPSATNFITLTFESEKLAEDFSNKMLFKGVILRHLIGFGLPNCVRVTVGLKDENDFLIKNIQEI